MQKRKRINPVSVVLLAALLGIPVWLTYRAVRQERLNQALLAALQATSPDAPSEPIDIRRALALLRQGADPNAQVLPRDRRSLWRRFHDRLYGTNPKPKTITTPLLAALGFHYHPANTPSSHISVQFFFSDKDEYYSFNSAVSFPLIKALLDHGADANVSGEGGYTPLTVACYLGYDAKILELLRTHGAHLDVQGPGGETALHTAVEHGKVNNVRYLLEHGARVDIKDEEGRTPLIVAASPMIVTASADISQMFALLLAHKADVNSKDNDGETALHLAVYDQESVDNARYLLEHGAHIEAKDTNGETPLMVAASRSTPRMLAFLLAHKADLNSKDKDGDTALHTAVEQGKVNNMHYLLEHGARVDVKNKEGETPWTVTFNSLDDSVPQMLALLLAHEADVNGRNNNGETALMVFAGFDCTLRSLHLLLTHHADVSLKNEGGQTALIEALDNQREANAIVLIQAGTDVNVRDKAGKTPLLYAIEQRCSKKMLRILLSHGAKVHVSDKDGKDALALARSKRFPYIALLRQAGAAE